MRSLFVKKNTYMKGILAELYALIILYFKGYRLVKWRMRNYISEIDLLMYKNKTLIAIEVKYRPTIETGLYAVNFAQQDKIRRALELFYGQSSTKMTSLRCDICVVQARGKFYHLKNAF